METQTRSRIDQARDSVAGRRLKDEDTVYQKDPLEALCSRWSRMFHETLARSCSGVSVAVETDAYSLALLLLAMPYYAVNHGKVPKVGRMTFVTIWNRIVEASSALGVLTHKVVGGRCAEDYIDLTNTYTVDSSLRTSRDKAHLVIERRRRIELMYSTTMGEDLADTDPEECVDNVVVSSSISLCPSFYQAISDAARLAGAYRNEQNLHGLR